MPASGWASALSAWPFRATCAGGEGHLPRRCRRRPRACRCSSRQAVLQSPACIVSFLGLPDLPFHFRLDRTFRLLPVPARRGERRCLCLRRWLPPQGRGHAAWAAVPLLPCVPREHGAACCSPTTPTPSWSPGRRWRCRRSFSSRATTAIRRSGAPAISICSSRTSGRSRSCSASACSRRQRATTPLPACAAAEPSPFWATVAFLLALFGFGAKAGILPLHVWLPEAHPAAPSPVSALMSAVMLKTAIYGLLRVIFDLLHTQVWWWGVLTLALGLATALFGVVFSAVQSDMKRLLAYSSIENIGFVLVGIGLAITFRAYGMTRARGARPDRRPLPLPQPRLLQEPALPLHRLGAACDERARSGQARRPHSPHAVGRMAGLDRLARDRGSAAAERLRIGVAAAAGVPAHARAAAGLSQHADPGRRGGGGPDRRARRLRDGQILRRGLPRPAPRGKARAGARLRTLGAGRTRVARALVCAARRAAGAGDRFSRPGHPALERPRTRGRGGRRKLALPRAHQSRPGELQPASLPARHRGGHRHRVVRRAQDLPRSRAARTRLGLRLPAANAPHAGHRRRVRSAGAGGLRTLLPHDARAALPVRRGAPLPGRGRGSLLVLGLPSGGEGGSETHRHRRRPAARAHLRST